MFGTTCAHHRFISYSRLAVCCCFRMEASGLEVSFSRAMLILCLANMKWFACIDDRVDEISDLVNKFGDRQKNPSQGLETEDEILRPLFTPGQ